MRLAAVAGDGESDRESIGTGMSRTRIRAKLALHCLMFWSYQSQREGTNRSKMSQASVGLWQKKPCLPAQMLIS